MALRALARVNVAAIERNVARLRGELSGGGLCAVVKADAYGHGAVPVARAALAGGASWLAVVTVSEAAELRAAGIGGPVLVMGAISAQELPVALAAGVDVVAWSERFVAEVRAAAWAPVGMHVKLDTGLGRLGTRDVEQALAVARQIMDARPQLQLVGAMTHFATADEENLEFVERQLAAFGEFATRMRALHSAIVVHAANSAATLRVPASHFDLVRCGIAIYGCDPMGADPAARDLEPALELVSYVAAVKLAHPGESTGYGRRYRAEHETWIATIPIGYADGIRRELSNNCDVLINNARYRLVGTVSMDNITVDLGRRTAVSVGDAVTIIGGDGLQRQTVEDLARWVGTINYEVLTGISKRVPRIHDRDGRPL